MFVAFFSSEVCIYFGVLVEVLELVFGSLQILATFFFLPEEDGILTA